MLNEGLIFDNSSIPNPMHCQICLKISQLNLGLGVSIVLILFTKTISFHISFQIHDSQTYLVVYMFGTVLLVQLLFQTRRKGTIK